MLWLKCAMVCVALLRAHCYIPYSAGRCSEKPDDIFIVPYYGDGDRPKPPEIGHSYIAKYEMNTIDSNHPAWVEEYFDYNGKRAKISASVLGVQFVDIYDYGRGTVTSYRLYRPETSGWSSTIEDTCETVEMTKFKPALQILSYPFSKTARLGPQHMPTSNQALKYGPPYNYTYLEGYIGKETRNIQSEIFRGCVNEDYLNFSLRSNFYWGNALPFSYPSGDKRVPVYIEMRGPDINNNAQDIYAMMYVSWYEKDPKFAFDAFQIPEGLHCKYRPNRGRLPNMPSSFSYSVEETVFQLDGSGFLKAGFASLSYKKVWYDSELKLARIDMRPSEEDLRSQLLQSVGDTSEFISLLFDLTTGFTYVSSMAQSTCLWEGKQKGYFWNHPNGTLKTPEELFRINSNLQYKGKATVMGVEAETWTELLKNMEKSSIKKRQLSFSLHDKRMDRYRNEYIFSLIQEAVYEQDSTQYKRSWVFPEQNVTIRNYLYFNSFVADQDVFSQHACLQEKPAASYYINFKPLKACTLDAGNRTKFLTAFRNELAKSTKLSTILTVQNFRFRWYNENGTSVGFTFHENIPEEKMNETTFSKLAKQKVQVVKPLTVSFRLTAASETNECAWQSYLFHKELSTVF
uniref:Putative conserved secreted protein midgut overexpressed n=1 Tax=Rhipicephalus microplus TaxID=6941 RepID=A0A6M2CGR2_RHIMP